MIPSIYINLEDDVSKVVARLKKEKNDELILVCPKRCFLFNDSINLRLLKKQADLLKKTVWFLTMDEKGQAFAQEAGFGLKFLPKTRKPAGFSDITVSKKSESDEQSFFTNKPTNQNNVVSEAVKNLTGVFNKLQTENKTLQNLLPAEKKVVAKAKMPKVSFSDNIFPKGEILEFTEESKKPKKRKKILFIFLLVLFLVAGFMAIYLPKAEIVVYPKIENLVRDMEITASASVKAPDTYKLILPATKFSEIIDVFQKFESKGKKEVGNKASGNVRIYNFTKSPINLKSNTTILSVGNRNYRLAEDAMYIKPTTYKNAATKEINEDSLSGPIKIVAEEGGESYNIPTGTRMEIANQVFGSKPQLLYAKTETSIEGGTSRYLSFVQESDIEESKKFLLEQALKQANEKLQKIGMFSPTKAQENIILDFKPDKNAGSQSPNFEAKLSVKITGLAVNEADFKKLINDRISQTLSDNKFLYEKSGKITFITQNMDLSTELMVISVHFQGNSVFKFDFNDSIKTLTNKTAEEANEILRKNNEIDKVEITISPKWQKTIPWWTKRIFFKVKEPDI